ncbi:MAG: acetylxylan esterase, partial [Microbacterium sp.]
MPRFDLSSAELELYSPDVREPIDFDAFWAETITEARLHDAAPLVERTESPLRLVEVFDLTFPGFGGDPIRAWLTL